MKRAIHTLWLLVLCGALVSCEPINIFSPFIDPSKMGNDAKMEAGYNAIESGNYDEAVDLFSGVIAATSGEERAEAYIGRASAYLYLASPEIDSVVGDLISGNISVDNPSDIITRVVQNGDFTGFFDNMLSSADDFNQAVAVLGPETDVGILLESYQTNMMAATGIAAGVIAVTYDGPPWVPPTTTLDEEYGAIADENSAHPYNISTWDNASGNGLTDCIVDGSSEEDAMMSYLTAAFNALGLLEPNPPAGMTAGDVLDMQNNINEWVTVGLHEALLIFPPP
jgi:hypothetical protein